MRDAERQLVLVPGEPRIALEVAGDGPLVLFLHGIGGNRTNWRAQLDAVAAAGFRAAAWDARGYGDSGDYAGPLAFGAFADDLLRVLDWFGAGRAHVVGLSMGGRIALDFWRRWPGRVASLALADTSAGAAPDPAKVEAFLEARLRPLLEGATPADIAEALVAGLAGPNASEEARAGLVASHAALRAESYAKTLRAVTAFSDFPPFESVTAPALVIVGSEDRVAPVAHARTMAERMPDARLQVIEGAGHVSNLEAPGAFNAALVAFLREVAGSREVRLVRYPERAPGPECFESVDVPRPEPGAGEALVEVAYLSMDPVVRTRMRAGGGLGAPMRLGAAVEGRGVGRVVASRHPGLREGDVVTGELGWRRFAVLAGDALAGVEQRGGPLRHHLNALGPTGLAALFALEAGGLRAGDRVVIAPAAGAVGSLAVQIARLQGAHVLGLARGAAQLGYLRGLGVEAADAEGAFEEALAGGVDLFVDGVGCALHDRVVRHLNPRARVVLLGFVAGYGEEAPPRYGDAAAILMKRATMQGFLLADWMEHAAGARDRLAEWIARGQIVPAERVWEGLDQAPLAFAALFGEAEPGKQLVRVWERNDG